MAEEKTEMQEITPGDLQQVMRGADINQVAEQAAQAQETEEPEVVDPAEEKEVTEEKPEVIEGQEETEKTEAEPQELNLEFFNKQFSTEFKDDDSIKEALESIKTIDGLKAQIEEAKSMKEELDLLRGEADPMKYFDTEDDFRVAQFKREFQDKDPAMVAKLFAMDTSQASDFDILTWMTMLDNPNLEGGEVGARELVADIYGVEDPSNLTELDTLTKNKLRVSAGAERGRVQKMKSDIQMPEKRDYASVLEQKKQEAADKTAELTSSWQKITEKMVSEFPDIIINETDKDGNVSEFFRYSIGKDLTNEMVAPLVDSLVKAGIAVDESTVQTLGDALQKEYVYKNMDKIVQQAVKDKKATQEEETLEEEHNPGAPTDKERPKGGGNDVTARILAGLKNDGLGPKRAY